MQEEAQELREEHIAVRSFLKAHHERGAPLKLMAWGRQRSRNVRAVMEFTKNVRKFHCYPGLCGASG